MRKDLLKRLQKVAIILNLSEKIALSHDTMEQVSKRTLPFMKGAVQQLAGALRNEEKEVAEKLLSLIGEVIMPVGVIDQATVSPAGFDSKKVMMGRKPGSVAAIMFAQQNAHDFTKAVYFLMQAADAAGILQNSDNIERAKKDPNFVPSIIEAHRKLKSSLGSMSEELNALR